MPAALPRLLFLIVAACLASLLALPALAQAEAAAREGFYRFPTLRGPHIVFTAEGDLWRVGLAGGRAERITTHPDLEARAAISPDGRWLAFSGAYERAGEAYLMPLAGGVPQRLSWGGQNPRVWGFTPAGEVLVTAPSQRGEPVTQLYAIDPRTQAQRVLPAGQASDGALSADGHTLYFTRHGLGSDNVRAYRGGAMARLWRLDLRGNAEAEALVPAGAGNDQRPMPYAASTGPRVAFLSDRDGQFNLYSVDERGGSLQQHTRHRGWDIRHASIDGTRVVYALGADLHLIDLETGQDQRLPITLGGDADAQRARWVAQPQTFFESAQVSPDGLRVALSVRGRVATQGTGLLRRAELPVPADARCREAVFSHDNRHVFALCDIAPAGAAAAGANTAPPPEQEIWRFNADGSGTPLQITRGGDVRRFALFPSPDGRWLAHTDKAGRLTLTALTAAGPGSSREVVVPGPVRAAPQRVVWSPDSQAIAFARGGDDGYRLRLYLHQVAPARTLALTSSRYSSTEPAFTPDGRWLYFLSDRHFVSLNAAPWGDRNLGPYFDRRTQVYALALQAGGPPFPFQPRDETQPALPPAAAASAPASAPGGAAASSAPTAPARPAAPAAPAAPKPPALPAIDTNGLAERLFEVPLAAGNYTRLRTDGKRLYLLEADSTPERRTSLRTLAIENTGPQPELFAADVNDFDLTPDGKRLLLVRRAATGPQPGDIQLLDAAPKLPTDAAVLARAQVRWADWQIATDPVAEWRQMFDDAWRLQRDHFYDATLHGTDWPAVRRKYAALLPRVGDRRELAELMAQMVAEVGVLHSQVGAEDVRRGPDNIAPAGLGARLARVPGGFRIEQLYRSDPELPGEASPLARVQARVGDTITSVNGRALAGAGAVGDIGELLRGQVGRQVLLTLKPDGAGPGGGAERRVVVLPVSGQREAALREGDWEQGRLERALARSNGRVGYLRLRAMGRDDMATFVREFYAQQGREALVIDVRNNNGGSIDSWVLTQLLRRAWAWWQPRSPAGSESFSNMQQAWRGPIAVLIDADTYSDGETFAEGIQRLQLGTLVGRRTAGAGVWLSDTNRLLDRGIMRAAELGQFALDGSWLIEGRGVTPDIDVDNPPRDTHAGGDAQLDAAVNHLLRRLAEQPVVKPQVPPYRRP